MDYDSFKSWFEQLGRAWETRDPHDAAALFTDDATYQEDPFDEPMRGKPAILHYWSDVPQSQEQISFHSEILGVTSDMGFAHWWVSFVRIPSKNRVKLDGICVISLNAENRCYALREWWHRQEQEPVDAQA